MSILGTAVQQEVEEMSVLETIQLSCAKLEQKLARIGPNGKAIMQLVVRQQAAWEVKIQAQQIDERTYWRGYLGCLMQAHSNAIKLGLIKVNPS